MEVWSGDVKVDQDGQSSLHDVRLCLQGAGSPITAFSKDISLAFSSFIDLQDVPLPCLAGPVLDVFTTSQATENWLAKYLLGETFEYESNKEDGSEGPAHQPPWWAQGRKQSDLGILLRADGHISVTQFRLEVKEILLYAGIPDLVKNAYESPITPPGSSSPHACSETPRTFENDEPNPVRIYARLLYSGYPWSRGGEYQLHFADAIPTDEARFINLPHLEPRIANHGQGEIAKRRKVDTLFEEAARENKRSRKRGGGNIAHVMAKGDGPSPVLFPHGLREMVRGDSQDGGVIESQATSNTPALKRNLSRSKSIGSLRDLEENRPSSRHSNPAVGDIQKRSLLHRVSSMNVQDAAPSPTAESMSQTEAQNRNALTRVVMASLRLYGFQAKKKSPAATTDHQPPSTNDPDEEYKLLYHQTFKAAAFVFRKHIAVQCIGQPVLREVVDKLLGMFCVDPMKEEQPSESFSQSEIRSGGKEMGFKTLAETHGTKSLDSGLLFRRAGVPA